MKILFLPKVKSEGEEDLFVYESDINSFFYQTITSIKDHLDIHKDLFSEDEKIFIKDLLDSKCKDNVLWAYKIISNK